MTVSLKHKFQSAIPDSGDASIVQPSNWNDDHDLTMAADRILGRVTAGTGIAEELTATQVRTLLNVEDGATADQTKADIDALGINAATVNSLTVETAVPSGAVFTDTTYSVGNGGLTEINFTAALSNKLTGIESNADVTDATNVAAAGAVMDGDFSTNGLMSRTGAGTYSVVADNSASWNTAYGWGNHAGAGYLTTIALDGVSDVVITTVADGEILVRNAAGGGWINQTLSEAGIAATNHNHSGVYEPADADILKADTGDTLTAGFITDSYSHGTISSGTVTPAPGTGQEAIQHLTNGGAFTLAPPASPCTVIIEVTNNASAGVITTSGFTMVTGDALTTTDGHDFILYITKTANFSHLSVVAMQ